MARLVQRVVLASSSGSRTVVFELARCRASIRPAPTPVVRSVETRSNNHQRQFEGRPQHRRAGRNSGARTGGLAFDLQHRRHLQRTRCRCRLTLSIVEEFNRVKQGTQPQRRTSPNCACRRYGHRMIFFTSYPVRLILFHLTSLFLREKSLPSRLHKGIDICQVSVTLLKEQLVELSATGSPSATLPR